MARVLDEIRNTDGVTRGANSTIGRPGALGARRASRVADNHSPACVICGPPTALRKLVLCPWWIDEIVCHC